MNNSLFRPGGLKLTALGAEYAQLNSSSRVLDAGCGIGTSLEYLHRTFGCEIYGIDISNTAVAAARAANPDALILQADASSLPFEEDYFDAVFMECTLSLFTDAAKALKEAARVLKKEGSLILLTLSQPTGSQLAEQGRISLDQLSVSLSATGFSDIVSRNCTQDLVQFVVDAIFQYGSLESYIAHASQTIEGTVLDCRVSPKHTGYHLITARKKEL